MKSTYDKLKGYFSYVFQPEGAARSIDKGAEAISFPKVDHSSRSIATKVTSEGHVTNRGVRSKRLKPLQ